MNLFVVEAKIETMIIKVFFYFLCRSLCLFPEENCLQKDLAEYWTLKLTRLFDVCVILSHSLT